MGARLNPSLSLHTGSAGFGVTSDLSIHFLAIKHFVAGARGTSNSMWPGQEGFRNQEAPCRAINRWEMEGAENDAGRLGLLGVVVSCIPTSRWQRGRFEPSTAAGHVVAGGPSRLTTSPALPEWPALFGFAVHAGLAALGLGQNILCGCRAASVEYSTSSP